MMSDERGDKSEIWKLIHVGTSGSVVVNYWDFVLFIYLFILFFKLLTAYTPHKIGKEVLDLPTLLLG